MDREAGSQQCGGGTQPGVVERTQLTGSRRIARDADRRTQQAGGDRREKTISHL